MTAPFDTVTAVLATPPAPTTPSAARERIARLWQDILDKDDRTSPEEYPDMALITFDEFEQSILALLPDAAAIRAVAFEEAAEVADCTADEYDATSFTSTNAEQVGALRSKEQAAHEIAAAIRAAGEK